MSGRSPAAIVDASEIGTDERTRTMYATVHTVDGVPGPQDRTWVDAVLAALRARAVPAGALVAAPIGMGAGCVVAFWDAAADAPDGFTAGPVTVGAGSTYEIVERRTGPSAGPARYLQLGTFTGRSQRWGAAFDRADEERVWPAIKDLPGLVDGLLGASGGDRLVVGLAESVEALEAGGVAVMSTELLPWEDPADLSGPDTFTVQRLLHADLPVGADR